MPANAETAAKVPVVLMKSRRELEAGAGFCSFMGLILFLTEGVVNTGENEKLRRGYVFDMRRPMRTISGRTLIPLALAILVGLTGGCKSTYYAAYEKLGVYKRDLLKKRVTAARDDQQEAQQQFKDALTRLKEITK